MNFWPHDQMCWLTLLKLNAPVQFCSGACLYAEDKQFIIHIMLKDSEIIGYELCPQKKYFGNNYLKSSPNSKSKGCHQKNIAEKETLVHSHLPP